MTLDEARAVRNRVQRSLEPDTLPNLKVAELQELYDCLCGARSDLAGFGFLSQTDAFLQVLRQEMEAKIPAERAERHHKQVMCVARWTLFWAMIGGIGTVGLLLLDIPFSKLLHAITFLSSPVSSTPTATAAPTPTPTATISPSPTPRASPTPEGASTPAQTPIKFPPPAP